MEEMRKRWIGTMMRSKLWAWDQMERFRESERGDTNFVAIIVIIVIIMAILGLFKEKLKIAVESVFENLTNFINSNGN